MAERTWRVLVIDDEESNGQAAEREIHDGFDGDPEIKVIVSVVSDFDRGFALVKQGDCDIAVLDVRRAPAGGKREEPDAGRKGFEAITQVRFLPVIFWTARPNEVQDKTHMKPLVQVLVKDELERLPDAIRAAIRSGAVDTMSSIEQQVATMMRNHMWAELAPNWAEDTLDGQPGELAHILITRVAQSLLDRAQPETIGRPSHCYLYPPVSIKHRPGELLRDCKVEPHAWWVVLTPACDLEHEGKAQFALLARANLLESQSKFTAWKASRGKENWRKLQELLEGKIARFAYLPKYRDIPDLVLDLEDTKSVPIKDLDGFDSVAVLVAPHAEALLAKHSHFRGRIGTPDLHVETIRERLEQAVHVTGI